VIVTILLNIIAGLSAFLITFRIFRFKTVIESSLSFFIVYFTQIILTELALGAINVLWLENVLLFNSAILLVIWIKTRKNESTFYLMALRRPLAELLSNKAIRLAGAFILGFGLVKVYINLINPPFGWDNLSYHFAFPVEWLKHGNLISPATLCDDPSMPYYPINGSLFFLWFMLPLKNVFLADLGQLPFFIIAFLATYAIAREIRLSKEYSFYSAVLFLFTPNVFKQLEIAYVDVMLASLFLAAVYFLLRLDKDFSLKNCSLFSISFGLFLGTKTSAVIYGVFLVFPFLWVLFSHLKKSRLKKISGYILIFIAASCLLGGYSYLRNLYLTGNPIYPATIKFAGREIFHGVKEFASYRTQWTKEEFNLYKVLFSEGLGAQLIMFFLPALILSLPVLIIKKKIRADRGVVFILLLPALLLASFLIFMPQLWVRYAYNLLGIGYVAAMYISAMFNIPAIVIRILVCISVLASAGEMSGHAELAASMVLSLLLLLICPRLLKLRFKPYVGAILLLLFFGGLWYLNINYNKYEFQRYLSNAPFPHEDRQAWKWLDDNTQHSKIAYTGIPEVLPLYGTNFKNDVIYVSVNKVHPVHLHLFPKGHYIWDKDFIKMHKNLEEPGNFREHPDYAVWLKNLKEERADFLVVYSLRKVRDSVMFPLENTWAQEHPEHFSSDFSADTVNIYKFRQ